MEPVRGGQDRPPRLEGLITRRMRVVSPESSKSEHCFCQNSQSHRYSMITITITITIIDHTSHGFCNQHSLPLHLYRRSCCKTPTPPTRPLCSLASTSLLPAIQQLECAEYLSTLCAEALSILFAEDMSTLCAEDLSALCAEDLSILCAEYLSILCAEDLSTLCAEYLSTLCAEYLSGLYAEDFKQ